MEFDVDCDADIILGYDWLRAHDLNFLYESNAVCLCAECGCTSGRRVRLDLTLDAPASPATRLSPAEARTLLGTAGLGEVPTLESSHASFRPLRTRAVSWPVLSVLVFPVRPSGPPRRGAGRPLPRLQGWPRQHGLRTRWPALSTHARRSPTAQRRPNLVRRRRAGDFATCGRLRSPRVCQRACGPAARPASGPRLGVGAAHRDGYAHDAALAADEALVAGGARRVPKTGGLPARQGVDCAVVRLARGLPPLHPTQRGPARLSRT